MKVKVLTHERPDTTGPSSFINKVQRNKDPSLHPLERAREYTRALNAVKLEKIFAKPFVAALDGHTDAVKCICRTKSQLTPLFSGSCDGEVRLWNVASKRSVRTVRAHTGFVRGMCVSVNDKYLYSCGDDKTVKQWSIRRFEDEDDQELAPHNTFHSASMLTSVDHHWVQHLFATAGETVDVWDPHRSTPLHQFEWGCDYVLNSRFNPAESCLIGSVAADCSIGLYDLRGSSAIRKVFLQNRSNALCWNPREPVNFTVANEDANLYTFDMRKLVAPVQLHSDHVQAVLDVDYNPNGKEVVSASYDKTVRIFNVQEMRSREVYHTKRMQRVLTAAFSADCRFVFSGSEDTNVRVWKSVAWDKLGAKTNREKQTMAYRETLKEKFKHVPEIKRIKDYRHVPKLIKKMAAERKEIRESKLRKEDNRIKRSAGRLQKVTKKKKAIRKIEE